MLAVRLSLKDLERDYEKSEDDIKALQSVGQIVGEVLKQLDDERCGLSSHSTCRPRADATLSSSHREGVLWPALRCRLQERSPEAQAQERSARLARHDDPDHHAVRLS